MSTRFHKIKTHFADEAKRFDKVFFKVAPYYREVIVALVLALPFENKRNLKIIDLGCGTGNITQAVKIRYLNACISCLNLA